MFWATLTVLISWLMLIRAFDNHAYKIQSVLSNTTVRVDMNTNNLIVSDVEYPGWSEFFYMFADPDGETFTLANFAFRENQNLGVDCSAHNRRCMIGSKRTHFRLSDPSLRIDTKTNIISVDDNGHGVWTVDTDGLPSASINFEKPDGSLRQSFILLRWE